MPKKFLGVIILMCLSLNTLGASELSSAQSLASQGVITDSSDYRLNDTITRKEMMKIVMNLSGKNVPSLCSGVFSDVENDWGCKYIEEALNQSYIALNDNFRPNDSITKAESMKLILKARSIDKVQNTSDWQGDYMQTAYQNALISSTYSDHNAEATRGWIFEVAATPKGSSSVTPSTTTQAVQSEETIESPTIPGSYIDYNAGLIGATDVTVLFFHASWCPSCQAADKNILEEDIDSTNITLMKTDYDSNTELRKKYGVTYQHTFVQVDVNGNLIKKWSGSNSLADIQAKIQ